MIGLTWYFLTDPGLNIQADIKDGTKFIALFTGIGGAAAIVYGLLGIATAKLSRVLCICSYGLFSIVVLGYLVLIAVVLLSVIYMPQQSLADLCNGETSAQTPSFFTGVLNQIRLKANDLDAKMSSAIATNMCRSPCPCTPV